MSAVASPWPARSPDGRPQTIHADAAAKSRPEVDRIPVRIPAAAVAAATAAAAAVAAAQQRVSMFYLLPRAGQKLLACQPLCNTAEQSSHIDSSTDAAINWQADVCTCASTAAAVAAAALLLLQPSNIP